MPKTKSKTAVSKVSEVYPIFVETGNPFVDSGIAALSVLSSKRKPQDITLTDIKKGIKYLTSLYKSKIWTNNIHGIIFQNFEGFNPPGKPVEYRLNRFKENMDELIRCVTPLQKSGNCVACGMRNGIPITRMRVPLLGSKSLVNFFPSGREGELFCSACILAVQFVPIACEKVGKMAMILSTHDWEVNRAFVEQIVIQVKQQASRKEAGLISLGYQRGPNAIFAALSRVIANPNLIDPYESFPPLRFYHFTNFGQSAFIDKYDLPSVVFNFIVDVTRLGLSKEWNDVVRRGYRKTKKAKDEETTAKTVLNSVLEKLLKGKTIVRYFIDTHNYQAIGSWDLLQSYLKKVRKMSEKRMEIIKRIADQIFSHCEKRDSAKKIVLIDRARRYRDFRQIILRINSDVVRETGESLVTFDEFVLEIAPDGGRNWNEIRDLLLFRIYEVGSKWLQDKSKEISVSSNDEETEE